MPSFNQCTFAGHMTRDPEIRHTTTQKVVCDFGIAVNHKYGDKEEVMFLDCTAWEKTGEVIAEHFSKGKPILVTGRLRLETWDAKDGTKRSKHCLTVNSFSFIGGNREDADTPSQQQKPYPRTRQTASAGKFPNEPQLDDKAFDDAGIPFAAPTA